MSSDLFDYLMKDREAELRSAYESKLQQQEARFRQELHQVLEDTLLIRFPDAPLALIRDIRRVQHPADLHRLIVAVQQAPDLAAAAQVLREAGQQADGG